MLFIIFIYFFFTNVSASDSWTRTTDLGTMRQVLYHYAYCHWQMYTFKFCQVLLKCSYIFTYFFLLGFSLNCVCFNWTIDLGMMWQVLYRCARSKIMLEIGKVLFYMNSYFLHIYIFLFLPMSLPVIAGLEPLTLGQWGKCFTTMPTVAGKCILFNFAKFY